MNKKLTSGAPELHPIPVHWPWFHIGIDFVGPLPLATDGSQYLLTISDYFSKWVEAVATPNKEAVTVAEALFKVHDWHFICTSYIVCLTVLHVLSMAL